MYNGWFTGKTTKLPYGSIVKPLEWKGSFFKVKNSLEE